MSEGRREPTAPLSIGMFTYSTKPRGSVVHAACLADALAVRGHAVTLYALDKDGDGFFRSLAASRLVMVPARRAPDAIAQLVEARIGEVAAFCTAGAIAHDVVHAQDCLVASGLIAARTRQHVGLLCRTVHHVESFASPYLEACQRRSVLEADLSLSVSRATEQAVRATYGRATTVVGNGVDAARFAGIVPDEAALVRDQIGVAREVPLAVSVGGVEPRKNSLVMLDAFVRARRVVPDLHWVIAGGASIFEHAAYRSTFEQRFAALEPATRAAIVRTAVLDETALARLLVSADVLVHASTHEGFGLCVLEAMAANTPVVVSRGAPFDEYLDDACAVRVDPIAPDDVAAGIVRALRSPPTLRDAARMRASCYAWDRCAEQHERAYRCALGAPP